MANLKPTGRDVALRVCKFLTDPEGKVELNTIKTLAARALRLEGLRVDEYKVRREAAKREQAKWERERAKEAAKKTARRSRLGKLLALRNKVVKHIKANYPRADVGDRQYHNIYVRLSGWHETLTIETFPRLKHITKGLHGAFGGSYNDHATREGRDGYTKSIKIVRLTFRKG